MPDARLLPELFESKKKSPLSSLAGAGHALVLYTAGIGPARLPAGEALQRALARRVPRDGKPDSPLAVQTGDGTLVAYVACDPAADTFMLHETIRKAARLLLDEQPHRVHLVVVADDAHRARLAEAGAYVLLVNAGAGLPEAARPRRTLDRIDVHGQGRGADFARVRAVAEGNVLCRRLTALPPNDLTPGAYRKRIAGLARAQGWTMEVFDHARLKKMGAGAFCAVAQGSPAKDAAIVRLAYRGAGRKSRPFALVGKGICFDTGGHNLKPARAMQRMNEDMNGSAVALGVLTAATRLGLPLNLEVWLALAENDIGAGAYRPSEVVKALDGTTIEIVHTDAEGRMVLADTLALAVRARPAAVIDFATLTGAMHVAVGVRMSGIFATDSKLAHQAVRAGTLTGERVVAFPAPADYDVALESRVADIKQCTLEGEADHILATRFLSRFVGDTPWVHVDLAAHICKGGLGAVIDETNGFGVAWGVAMLDALAA